MAIEHKTIYTCDGCKANIPYPIGRLYTKEPTSYGYGSYLDNKDHHFCTECTNILETQFNIKYLKKKAP